MFLKCTYMDKAEYFSTFYFWNSSHVKDSMVCPWGQSLWRCGPILSTKEESIDKQPNFFLQNHFTNDILCQIVMCDYFTSIYLDWKDNWLAVFYQVHRKDQNFNFTWQIVKLGFYTIWLVQASHFFFFLSHKYTTVTSYNIFEKIKPPNLKTLRKLIVPMCKLHSSSQELLLEAILTVSGHKDFILRACSSNCTSNDNGFPLRSLFIPSPRAPPCD